LAHGQKRLRRDRARTIKMTAIAESGKHGRSERKVPRDVNAAKQEPWSRDSVRLGRAFPQPEKVQGDATLFFLPLEHGEHFERLAVRSDGYAKIVKSERPFRSSAPFDLQVRGELENSLDGFIGNRS
jgi:hypothetical protein